MSEKLTPRTTKKSTPIETINSTKRTEINSAISDTENIEMSEIVKDFSNNIQNPVYLGAMSTFTKKNLFKISDKEIKSYLYTMNFDELQWLSWQLHFLKTTLPWHKSYISKFLAKVASTRKTSKTYDWTASKDIFDALGKFLENYYDKQFIQENSLYTLLGIHHTAYIEFYKNFEEFFNNFTQKLDSERENYTENESWGYYPTGITLDYYDNKTDNWMYQWRFWSWSEDHRSYYEYLRDNK